MKFKKVVLKRPTIAKSRNHGKQTTSGNPNKTNFENGHLVFSIFKKKQENNGVGYISH